MIPAEAAIVAVYCGGSMTQDVENEVDARFFFDIHLHGKWRISSGYMTLFGLMHTTPDHLSTSLWRERQ